MSSIEEKAALFFVNVSHLISIQVPVRTLYANKKKKTFTLLIVDAFYIFYSIQTLCDTVQLECWKRNVFVAEKISSMHLRLSGQQISLIFAFQLNFGAFGQACVVPICCQQAITKSCSVKNYLVVG